jgi:hypothetical protein
VIAKNLGGSQLGELKKKNRKPVCAWKEDRRQGNEDTIGPPR